MVYQEYQNPKVGKYLRYGYWYSAHQKTFKQYGLGFILSLTFVIWAWLAFNFYQFIKAAVPYEAMLRDLAAEYMPIVDLHRRRAVAALAVDEAFVMPGGTEQTADFAARAYNPNERWTATADYFFTWPGGKTLAQSALLLPGERTLLTARGVTINALPAAAGLELAAVRWQRLRTNESLELARALPGQITVSEKKVAPGAGASVASYTVTNQSIYGFWRPRFLLALTRAGQIVALGLNELPDLPSGGQFALEYRMLQNISGASLEVFPIIDVLDPSAYYLPSGGDLKL